jgi:hypothetical protein
MRRSAHLIFSALLFFLYFSPFMHFSSNMTSSRLTLPRLSRRLKGEKRMNRHASPYRLKNYALVGSTTIITGSSIIGEIIHSDATSIDVR